MGANSCLTFICQCTVSSKQYATVTAQKLIQREITHVLFCMSLCHSLKQYATKTTSGKG